MVAMNNDPDKKRQREQLSNAKPVNEASKANEQIESEQQRKYRQLYLEQLRRRSCPGCGETDLTDFGENN